MELKELKTKFNKLTNEYKSTSQETKEINNMLYRWRQVMVNKGVYNKENKTFTLTHIKKTDYGFSARLIAPFGLAYEELENLKPFIETGLECIFQYKTPDHKQFALIKIIKPQQVKINEIPFEPVKVKPYQLYFGRSVANEPIIFDVNITPHALVGGQQRRGKNGAVDHAITSLLWSCSPDEIEVYLFQCAKADLLKYQCAPHIKECVRGDTNRMVKVMENIIKEIDRRVELFKPMVTSFKGDNLYHYNQIHKNKLPYIYLIFDEIMELKDKNDSNAEKVLSLLQKIAQFGGAMGVNYIVTHQKPQRDYMPVFLKNMSSIRICFGYDDPVGSEVVLGQGVTLAWKLPPRRAYYTAGEGFDLLFTTDTWGNLERYIPKVQQPSNVVTIKKDDAKPLENVRVREVTKEEVEKWKLSIQRKKEREQRKKNKIPPIPNFVPYEPPNPNRVIIDQTDMATKPGRLAKESKRNKKEGE